MNTSAVIKTAVLTVLLLLLVSLAAAQYRAGVQGVVTDPSGAIVPEATVTLTNTETNISRTATTSSSGVFSIPGLSPGKYTITVEKAGFAKKVVADVSVKAEQMQALNVQLAVGAKTETVTVSAENAPAIDTQSATIAGTITTREVEALPQFGRDPFQLMLLTPGAFGDNGRGAGGGARNLPGNAGPGGTGNANIFQTENQVQVSANGTRNTSNSFMVDGVAVNSLNWGGASVVTPNSESIKEMRIEASSYSAENARAGGAQVQVISKNGTNNVHGSAFFRAARPGLNAFQKWNGPTAAVQRVTDRFNQFGGSVGGPIVKEKLFFFVSYETQRLKTVSTGSGWYETPQFMQLVGAAKPNSIAARIVGYPGEGASYSSISPTGNCAAANIPTTTTINGVPTPSCADVTGGIDIGSPLTSPLGTPDPTWTSSSAGIGNGLDGIPDIMFVNTINPNTRKAQQFNARFDYQASSKDLIAFTTYQTPVYTTSFNGPAREANFWINDRLSHAETLLWTHTFAPTVINEARLSASRWSWDEVESNPQEPWGLATISIDSMRNAKVQNLGAPGPGIFAQTTYNFRDTASWVHGSHVTKFGADIYWEQNNAKRAGGARPTFSFRNIWSFANDAPYQETGTFDPRTGVPSAVRKYIRSSVWGFFVQDDWRVRPNLTLNMGVRWEYFNPLSEANGELANGILGTGTNMLTGLRMRLGGDLYRASKSNWAPQLGFAWTPLADSSRFVLRGGIGVGFTRTEGAILMDSAGNPPFVSSATLTGAGIVYAVPSDPKQFYDWPANPATIINLNPETKLPTSGSLDLNIYSDEMHTPTTYRYSLDAQYELGNKWVATLGYQGSQTRHYSRKRNLNWFLPQHRNPVLRNVYLYSNDGNAHYDAMLAGLKHNFAQSFLVDVQYRWSNTRDTGSNEYYIGDYPFDLKYLKGPADFDVRHNFKVFGVWTPPFFKGNNALAKIAGGWQISGILNWHTGFPWTPVYGATGCNVIYAGSGYCNLMPAAYLGGAGTDYSNETFMKPNGNFQGGAFTYFTAPTWASDGTIPAPPGVRRNSLMGPGYMGIDMTLQKSFGLPGMKVLGESAKFEFRADFFNIFNKLNLASPNNVMGTPASPNKLFGQSQSALAGRVVNLQARFTF